jgi:aryl-alcohol dehydrogenase-like predicted oxidoreductase
MQLSLGSANFNFKYGFKKKKLSLYTLNKIIQFIKKKLKIIYIDTAFDYSGAITTLSKIDIKKFKIGTKIKFKDLNINKNLNINEEFIKNKIIKLLSNLNIKKFEYLLIHDFYLLTKKEIIFSYLILKELKKNQLVDKIGISVYEPKELTKIWKIWKPDIVQLPLNIIDQRFLKTGWIKKLNKAKIKIHVRSIFLQGVLISKLRQIKNSKLKQLVLKFIRWSSKTGISRIDACISFIKNQKIDRVIFGIENQKQIETIIKSFELKRKIYPSTFVNNKKYLIDPRVWQI